METGTIPLLHVVYATLSAVAVMIAATFAMGMSFWKNVVSFCLGFSFLLVLYALGIKAALWAMLVLVALVVLGVISSAVG